MCGRFTLTTPAADWASLFDVLPPDVGPRYNIAPSQAVAAVRSTGGPRGSRVLGWPEWGFIPRWAREPAARPINARAETVAEKPTFRDSFRDRRCLIVADGFYEWRKEGRFKQPYWIRLADGRPFAFAGLWDRWIDGAGQSVDTCAILTTESNARLRPLHDRMPVILEPAGHAAWLDPTTEAHDLREMLHPLPDDRVAYRAVSRRVNSPVHDDPECIEVVEEQSDLFG